MSSLAEKKARLRREAKTRLKALNPEEKAAASAAILAQLRSTEAWQQATTIGLYASLPSEPATRPIFEAAQHDKPDARLFFPLMREDKSLKLYQVKDWDSDLQATNSVIFEPDPALCPSVAPAELDLILVPGLGFAAEGCRLGRGGGSYDRLLAQLSPTCQRIGVFFSCQELPELQVEPHDQPLDLLITENELA